MKGVKMGRLSALFAISVLGTVLLVFCKTNAQPQESEGLEKPVPGIIITDPEDGASVPMRPYVKGTVTDPDAEVWIIVHPMEVSDYWVQPSVSVKNDGTWKVMVHIGRPGDVDVGKEFEIMAVANPTEELYEGKILSGWPEAQWKSEVIYLTRE
jgi:hypothetical protein